MKIKTYLKEIIFLPVLVVNAVTILLHNIKLGKKSKIRGLLMFFGNGTLIIGKNSVINSGIIANPVGGIKTIFYIINESRIEIGENCGISNSVLCSSKGIKIGNRTLIGASCSFYDNDFHSLNYKKRSKHPDNDIRAKEIVIGNDVFIGANSIILKGVVIGDRSIVGAGSVVKRPIPPDEMWAGNPAQFIKTLNRGGNK